MTTLGQQILTRLEALEATVADVQLNATPDGWARLDEFRTQMRQEMANVREQMERLPNGGTQSDNPNGMTRSLLNPKDCMPQVLGANYKTFWRTWSYKSRDWMGQMDRTLKSKLEKVESETKELSESYIADLNLSPPN